MNTPEQWLLILEDVDGSKRGVNLWEAIENGLLTVRVNPLSRLRVKDICGDCEENREGIPDIFAEEKSRHVVTIEGETVPDILFDQKRWQRFMGDT